jgi:hypothetical protein
MRGAMSTLDDLMAALAGTPRLPGALCRGESELFDQHDDPGVIEHAIAICHSCPARADCERWVDSSRPGQRPHGVIAGRVNRPPQPRKRAS